MIVGKNENLLKNDMLKLRVWSCIFKHYSISNYFISDSGRYILRMKG